MESLYLEDLVKSQKIQIGALQAASVALNEEIATLKGERRALTEVNDSLTTRIVDHLGNLGNNSPVSDGPIVPDQPAMGWTASTVHPLPPFPTRPSPPPGSSSNPNDPAYVLREPWSIDEARERNDGSDAPSSFAIPTYLYHSDTHAFGPGDFEALQTSSKAYFEQLRREGRVPDRWDKLDPELLAAWRTYICLLHPCLRRCFDHFKADAVGQKFFSLWKAAVAVKLKRAGRLEAKVEVVQNVGAVGRDDDVAGKGIGEEVRTAPEREKRSRSDSGVSSTTPPGSPLKRARTSTPPGPGGSSASPLPIQAAATPIALPIPVSAPKPMPAPGSARPRTSGGLKFRKRPQLAPSDALDSSAARPADLPMPFGNSQNASVPLSPVAGSESSAAASASSGPASIHLPSTATPTGPSPPIALRQDSAHAPPPPADTPASVSAPTKTHHRLSELEMYRRHLDSMGTDWNDAILPGMWVDAKTDHDLMGLLKRNLTQAKIDELREKKELKEKEKAEKAENRKVKSVGAGTSGGASG